MRAIWCKWSYTRRSPVNHKSDIPTSKAGKPSVCTLSLKFPFPAKKTVSFNYHELNGKNLRLVWCFRHFDRYAREIEVITVSIVFKLYSPHYSVNITFSKRGRSAKSYFSCVVYYVFSSSFNTFLVFSNYTKTIIRLRLKYWRIFTSNRAQ